MRDVALHALAELGAPDVLVILQPTSPLRRAEHVDAAVERLVETRADCVVSVVEVPHRFGPESLMELADGRLAPISAERYATRQAKPKLYARNGPAVLALRVEGIAERAGLYDGDCRPLVMDARSSVDVDEAFDLEVAECLLRRR